MCLPKCFLVWRCTEKYSLDYTGSVRWHHLSATKSPKRSTLKGGPQLADRAETADHIHKDATDRYAPCSQALLLFARTIVNIGDFYYCVVLTNSRKHLVACIKSKKLLPFPKVFLKYAKNLHGQICNRAFMPLWPSRSVWRHGGL